jgi:DNA-binding transcriptional MerR regulator
MTAEIAEAFSADDVVRLTGLTRGQLRRWVRDGFYRPTHSDDHRPPLSRVYSYKDMAALRVLSVLRNKNHLSLQRLREVSEKLSHLEDDRWTRTTLYFLRRKVLFTDPETGTPREIVRGHYGLRLSLETVLSDMWRDYEEIKP